MYTKNKLLLLETEPGDFTKAEKAEKTSYSFRKDRPYQVTPYTGEIESPDNHRLVTGTWVT